MNTDSNNTTEQIENLFKIIRLFLILSSSATTIYLLNTLRSCLGFAKMCATSGLEPPSISVFFFNHFQKMMLFVIVWQMLNIFIILKFKYKTWSYSCVIVGLVAMFFLEKVVFHANFAPITQMINELF